MIYLIFQQILNYTYDLTKPPDGQWGAIQPDGSWSGLVGMLIRQEIDMGKLCDIILNINVQSYRVPKY